MHIFCVELHHATFIACDHAIYIGNIVKTAVNIVELKERVFIFRIWFIIQETAIFYVNCLDISFDKLTNDLVGEVPSLVFSSRKILPVVMNINKRVMGMDT